MGEVSGRGLRQAALSPSATEPVPVSALSGDDQPRNEWAMTDKGLMHRSQYAGYAVAAALRERGLWRPGPPDADIVMARLADMAAIARAVIKALDGFDAQADIPTSTDGD